MKYRALADTGVFVSELCLGAMTFGGGGQIWQAIGGLDQKAVDTIVHRALDSGINFLDTADVYSAGESEVMVGKALAGRRHDVVLATKVRGRMGKGPNQVGLSRLHIIEAVEASLKRLGTDHIDLYQIHRGDPLTAIDETLRALDDLVRQGKVRYLGCSNFAAWMLANALLSSDRQRLARFDCVQPRYNLLYREIEHELLPLCRFHGIGVIPYNPIAGGFLSGKYRPGTEPAADARFGFLKGRTRKIYHGRYWHEAQFEAVSHLQEYFAARKRSLVQVAIGWVLAQRDVTSAIVGASSAAQLRESLPATEITLDAEEMETCNEVWFDLPRLRDPAVALR